MLSGQVVQSAQTLLRAFQSLGIQLYRGSKPGRLSVGLVELYQSRLQQLPQVVGRVRLHSLVLRELNHLSELITLCLNAVGDVVRTVDDECRIREQFVSRFELLNLAFLRIEELEFSDLVVQQGTAGIRFLTRAGQSGVLLLQDTPALRRFADLHNQRFCMGVGIEQAALGGSPE